MKFVIVLFALLVVANCYSYRGIRPGGQKECRNDEIFVECGSACEDTCENYRNTFRPCTLQCVIGCKCVEPKIRNANGECVLKEQC
ncbi:chymotrypsin inhibitor-like protein [Leptotrombidium deliense]|uniref:Chymotrypsin inhibitor-like protein n=1 Tax=Leptotrombidium deliense TaxID=299467 RepID=A0A443S9X4_9ACAR|nr:chymotrypsin inhibitor-like protein [Leptotrombidium deliense]